MDRIINDLLIFLNNIGSGFCNHAVSMFAQSGVLIILLLIIDFMLRKKVRAVFRYCVWMLVFIKLILPPTLSLPTGIGYWCGSTLSPKRIISKSIDDIYVAESTIPDMSEDSVISTEPSLSRPSRPISATMTPADTSGSNLPHLTWQAMVFLVWLMGVFVFSVLVIQRVMSVLGLIVQSKPAQGQVLDTLSQCQRQVGIDRNVELQLSNNIQSPAVCGFFKPIVLMPNSLLEKLSAGKLRAVLIHELVHIKRYDLWINFAQTFLQIIYFYNPFVWLANAMVRRIREQAVDETVLVTLGAEAKSYSNTLIDIAEMAFFKTSFGLRLFGVAESKKSIHRRIRHMLSRPVPISAKIGVLGVVTIVTLAAALLPMAAAARNKEVAAETSKLTEPEFIATLPNGVTVELVALCKYGGASTDWWRPDGTELAKEIRIKRAGTVAASGKAYAVAVKVKGPEDISLKWGKIKGATGGASLEVVDSQGQAISNIIAQKVNIDEKLTTTSIRLGVATGDWETKAEHNGKGMSSLGIEGGGIAFSEAYESNGVVKINVSDDFLNLDHRVISIDKEGTEHIPQSQSWSSAGKVRQTIAGFHNLTLNQIKEFQYQVRPCDWAEFKNVSLKPGVTTDVEIGYELADTQAVPAGKNLQSLIDSAKPGDTVTIPRGIYKEPVEIFKSLTLKGESRTECIFEVTANRPAIFIDTEGKGKVAVQDLTIKWQLATSDKGIERPYALGVKDTKAEIKNCVFLALGNFQRSPVAVRVDGFSDANIGRSRFDGFEYVICYGEGTKGKTTDCLIMNCGHQGIINYSGATLHVERNVITGSKYHAVRCTGGTLHVKDNLLINNANRGIYLGNKSGNGTVTNNLIVGNSVGISSFARAKYEIKNNVIVDSSFAGIGMDRSCFLTIQDNIFADNERGWAMFDRGTSGANTSYRNTFWQNKVDTENFEETSDSIKGDPGFMDPDNGDFSLKPGPAKENKQGLTNPQVFKALWKIWKNRKDKNEPFASTLGLQSVRSDVRTEDVPTKKVDYSSITVEGGKVVDFDDFNGSLNLDWEILHDNPTHYSLTKKPGMLTITTQKGGFAWSGTDYENIFLIDCPALPSQSVQITTCISGFNPDAPWQQTGLIFWNDDDNYLKWVCQFGTERTFSYLGETNAIRKSHRSFAVPQGVDRFWLRTTKQGDRYKFLTSLDGKSFVSYNAPTDPHGTQMTDGTLPWGNGSVKKIGLFVANGLNSEAPEIDASFEFFEVRIFQAEAEPQSESARSEEPGKSQASTLRPSSKDEVGKRYQNDLNAFFSEIDKTYPFFDLKNTRGDWARTKEKLTIRVRKCESDSEFMRIILDATKCLRDSHVRIYNNSVEIPWPEPEYYPLIGFMPARGNTVVIMMSPLGQEQALPIGTVVKTIDGVNAREYLDARAKETWEAGGHPSPQRARLFAYRIPLKGSKGTKHKIVVQRQDGEEEIVLECTKEARGWPHTYNMPAEMVPVGRSFHYTKLPSGVGYMYLRRVDSSVTQGISEAVKTHPDVRGWIVDLRGNGGGGYGSELIQMIKFLPRPIAVLIDDGCMSAGETLARDIRRNAGARLFGSKTAGSSSSKRSWQFPSGIASVIIPTRSRWRADGKPIEYNGIEPDEKIEASSEDLIKGLNTEILRAEEYIRSQASNVARYQKNVMEEEASIFDFEIDQKYTIPEENLELTEQMDDCADLLKKMYSAIANFEAEQGQLPNWLSDLVPKYLVAEDLLCPHDQTHESGFYRDPKMPCSYTYEFCTTTALPGLDPSQSSTTRNLKMKQIKEFGDVLPVVRCHKHEGKVLNLAVSGEIYWSSLNWEQLFEPGYRFSNLTSN